MSKHRLEAFSDGVFAIIITIMVLELKIPKTDNFTDLLQSWPTFISYLLSFLLIGIYWNNHHHMIHTINSINGAILWANLHLLFWLTLVPFVTSWLGKHFLSPWPVAIYGLVFFVAALAYFILARTIIKHHGPESMLKKAVGKDYKGILSIVLYFIGIPIAFVLPIFSLLFYLIPAGIWLIPDKRVENQIKNEKS